MMQARSTAWQATAKRSSKAVGCRHPVAGRARAASTSSPQTAESADPSAPGTVLVRYKNLELTTKPGIALFDITEPIQKEVAALGVQEGWVHVVSRHTTTALTINENEARLLDDIRQWCHKLAPPGHPYLHNDLHLREAPDGWPGGHAAWVQQEPINAHSHLLSIAIGNTLTVPVTQGRLALGTWQSVLLVELDGPRPRTVGVQVVGLPPASTA